MSERLVPVPDGIEDPVVVSAMDLRDAVSMMATHRRNQTPLGGQHLPIFDAEAAIMDALDAQVWEPDPEVVKRWVEWWNDDTNAAAADVADWLQQLRAAGLDVVLREDG